MPIARIAPIVSAIRAGARITVVKGSPGSKMNTIVNAPHRRIPGKAAHDEAGIGPIECFTG
jgi:hypothetical protein